MANQYEIPILFLIFKREESSLNVLQEIRKIKPKHLYIAADGPRDGNDDDVIKCEITRNVVLQAVDWDCEVKTFFREENRGCGYGPAEAITWFFEHVEMGIILEDDIIPSQSFFPFCEELLLKYKDNPKIMSIAGTNFISKNYQSKTSYNFSDYAGNWGWATWKRAWDLFDYNISDWKKTEVKEKIKNKFTPKTYQLWEDCFNLVCEKNIDHIWDYQWLFCKFLHDGFGIIPSKNLTTNIGFTNEATHTSEVSKEILDANVQEEITFPLILPSKIEINEEFDQTLSDRYYSKKAQVSPSPTVKFNPKKKVLNILQKIIAKFFNSRLFLKNPYLDLNKHILYITNKKASIPKYTVTSGQGTVFYPEAIVYNPPNDPTKIIIGNHSHIQGEFHIFNYGGKIEIGNNCYVGKDSRIWSGDHIKIGNDVLISHFCNIIDTNSHEINPYERADRSKEIFTSGHWKSKGSIKTSPIEIKNYAWISFNVSILRGVTIGEGAIIGACSVVTEDIPDWAVAIGNPAKVIKIIPEHERMKNYERK